MRQRVLVDTGPLVALINRRDRLHQWAIAQWHDVAKPLLTCEAVLTEACFLLQNTYGGDEAVMALLSKGVVQVPFRIEEESTTVKELLTRYRSVPMSLADACLVRMAEHYQGSAVMTLDSDFRIYRMNRNQSLPVIMPEAL